jgi:SsrA-binding protein
MTSTFKNKKPTPKASEVTLAVNRRAFHDYEILETLEVGIALKGGEIKSLRNRKVNLKDAFAKVKNGELWLYNMHISNYQYATGFGSFEPTRDRKLLAHRKEIDSLMGKVEQKSLTLIPIRIYLKNGKAKIELALVRGKHVYDKRRVLTEKTLKLEAERELKKLNR